MFFSSGFNPEQNIFSLSQGFYLCVWLQTGWHKIKESLHKPPSRNMEMISGTVLPSRCREIFQRHFIFLSQILGPNS